MNPSDTLKGELKPGETVIWQGQADTWVFLKKAWKLPVILILAAARIFWVVNKRGESFTNPHAFIGWILLIFAVAGLVRTLSMNKKRLYVLTDQRALVIASSVSFSHSRENLHAYTKICKPDGSGSILFGGGKNIGSGFMWLKNVAPVADIIDGMAKT